MKIFIATICLLTVIQACFAQFEVKMDPMAVLLRRINVQAEYAYDATKGIEMHVRYSRLGTIIFQDKTSSELITIDDNHELMLTLLHKFYLGEKQSKGTSIAPYYRYKIQQYDGPNFTEAAFHHSMSLGGAIGRKFFLSEDFFIEAQTGLGYIFSTAYNNSQGGSILQNNSGEMPIGTTSTLGFGATLWNFMSGGNLDVARISRIESFLRLSIGFRI